MSSGTLVRIYDFPGHWNKEKLILLNHWSLKHNREWESIRENEDRKRYPDFQKDEEVIFLRQSTVRMTLVSGK